MYIKIPTHTCKHMNDLVMQDLMCLTSQGKRKTRTGNHCSNTLWFEYAMGAINHADDLLKKYSREEDGIVTVLEIPDFLFL